MDQRPKKSQLSGRQNFTRKNFPDEVRKFFWRHLRQKCVNCFCDIYQKRVNCFRDILSYAHKTENGFFAIILTLRQCSMFTDCIVYCIINQEIQILEGKLSRQSENFPDCPKTFQTVWKLSRLSRNFQDSPETFQTVRKLSRLSGNFPDCLETFLTVDLI